MTSPECAKLCQGCNLVPKGVTAAVTHVQTIDWNELHRYAFANDSPELAERFDGGCRVHFRITESSRPGVDVDDTSATIVRRNGRTDEQIVEAIRNYPGPSRSLVRKLLGLKSTCGCLDNRPEV